MATERSLPEQRGAVWPPDDTEERILGSDWHQLTITNLRLGINEIARAEAGPDRPVQFQALSQTTLLDLQRRGATAIRVMPDLFVYKKPMDGHRLSFSVLREGPPALVIEVASPSTHAQDLDFAAGKGWIYAAAGIAEYLTIDTSGGSQEPSLRAWLLRDGSYREGELDAAGIWWSDETPIGIAVYEHMVTVYDRSGRPQVRESEMSQRVISAQWEVRQQIQWEVRQQMLLRVLERRFGALPASLRSRIAQADTQELLDAFVDAAIDASSLAEFERRLRS